MSGSNPRELIESDKSAEEIAEDLPGGPEDIDPSDLPDFDDPEPGSQIPTGGEDAIEGMDTPIMKWAAEAAEEGDFDLSTIKQDALELQSMIEEFVGEMEKKASDASMWAGHHGLVKAAHQYTYELIKDWIR